MNERDERDLDDRERDERPRIDLTPALGEGGSEVSQLGYDGVPDTGPVLGAPDPAERDVEDALDVATARFPAD